MREIKRVVVLGANGAMGAGSAEVFAAGGCEVTLLARSAEKAREGGTAAQNMAKSERIGDLFRYGSYDADLSRAVAEADLVFEALAEDLPLKKTFFAKVDQHRQKDALVATVSSGLSIAEMASDCSESFRRHFLGIHLFNPPNVIVGTEVIPHSGTDPDIVSGVLAVLGKRFGREAILTDDKPAFAGNRIGFKVLNEVAILAEERGVAFMDYLIGPYTGRAMPPLATIDLVGWDVHKAIVDNVHANTNDEAHALFAMPAYMSKLAAEGHLGNKTPAKGGFYRRVKEGKQTTSLVLNPKSGTHEEAARVEPVAFVEEMKRLNRVGRYAAAFKIFAEAPGAEADLARRVILGYISYGLNRVGEGEAQVVRQPRDVDRIMGFGFNWAPPTVLTDLIGIETTIRLMEAQKLPVPPVLKTAARQAGEKLFREPHVNIGRFFAG